MRLYYFKKWQSLKPQSAHHQPHTRGLRHQAIALYSSPLLSSPSSLPSHNRNPIPHLISPCPTTRPTRAASPSSATSPSASSPWPPASPSTPPSSPPSASRRSTATRPRPPPPAAPRPSAAGATAASSPSRCLRAPRCAVPPSHCA